ncbi:hypothetical protein ACI6Q2_22090 [Chitinophagaceae bacterium LWZ2-11]
MLNESMNYVKYITGIGILLFCFACKNSSKEFKIRQFDPYEIVDSFQLNDKGKPIYRRFEYYITEGYADDTAKLREWLNKMIVDKNEKNRYCDFYIISIYKTSSNTYYGEGGVDVNGKHPEQDEDLIARVEWNIKNPDKSKWEFYKDGKLLNNSPISIIIKDVDRKSEDTLNVHNEK